MNLSDILVGQASGGALGLLGALGTGILTFFQKKQDHKHAVEMARESRETTKLLGELKHAELAGELAKAREVGAAAAFAASVESAGKLRSGIKWISGLQEFTRPGLTWFFVAVSTYLTVATALGYFSAQSLDDPLLQYAVVNVLNATTMMISWWFGQRQIDKVTIAWGNRTAGATVGPAK